MTNTGKVRALTLVQKVEVNNWLQKKHEWLQGSRPSYAEAARHCGRDLNMEISPHTIKKIAEAFKFPWEPRHPSGGGVRKAVIVRLETEVANLRAEVANLRVAVTSLYDQIGQKRPGWMAALSVQEPVAVVDNK